jgi:peptidyl-prolyl cis-trans isomerase B (cyclophilin B)
MNRLVVLTALVVLASLAVSAQVGCETKSKWNDPYLDSLAAVTAEVRNPEHTCVTLVSTYGAMTFELYRDYAPAHADSFAARVKDGFYDSTLIHRIVKDFMIQGGNGPLAGKKDVSYELTAEFNTLPHKDGTLSMARRQEPNSASTQFFICLGRNRSTEWLDGKYTGFGQLLTGYDVLHRIAQEPVQASPMMGGEVSQPATPVWISDAYISDKDGKPL